MHCFFPHPPLPMDRFFRFVQPIAGAKRITNPKLSWSNLSRFIWNICLFHNDLMHPLCIRASDHSFLLRRVLFHPSQLRFTNNSNGNTMEVLPSWQILFTLGSAVANFVRDHDLLEIQLLCFSWCCCFYWVVISDTSCLTLLLLSNGLISEINPFPPFWWKCALLIPLT